jgi:hypothetical protein
MSPPQAAARDQVGRAVGVIALLGIALIHLLDAIGKLEETPYVFWLYILLMAATAVVAVVLLRTDSRLAWLLVAGISAATIIAFVLSRTTGLPDFSDDVGNWTEPLGVASLWVEGSAVLLGIYKVATTPRIQPSPVGAVVD